MSAHRRRPQHSHSRYTTSSAHYVQEYEEPRYERPRYVPEDWQEAWAGTTDDVCREIHRRWAYRLYPFDPQARDDLLDWTWVEACQFATVYKPKPEPDAEEHWERALASLLLARIRWHWAAYHGKKAIFVDEEGRKRTRVTDSVDAILERAEHRQEIHAASARILDGALWGYRPIAPERYVLLMELAEGTPDDQQAPPKATGLCSEPGCDRPARTRGLCTMHLQRATQLWGSDIDQMHPTLTSQRPTTCTTEGCDKPVMQSGLCDDHWLAARPLCRVEGCGAHLDNKAADGLCPKHYKRQRATGTTDDPPPPTRTCSIDGCERPHLAKGMCLMHYQRARKAAS